MEENWNDWRTGRHVVYNLRAHIILTPKYRREIMTRRVTRLLEQVFGEVCTRFECTLESFEAIQGHAHLLIGYTPKTQLSTLIMSLKTNSSKQLRDQHWPETDQAFHDKHFWTPSYCIAAAGEDPIETMNQYIENQDKPRRKYDKKQRS
ncbi:IS200/IS605 family transposase [Bifidobacterium callitrichidarum]|nr:IS200/IS605 family transposase [Bifidobacterium callitrichidarum]